MGFTRIGFKKSKLFGSCAEKHPGTMSLDPGHTTGERSDHTPKTISDGTDFSPALLIHMHFGIYLKGSPCIFGQNENISLIFLPFWGIKHTEICITSHLFCSAPPPPPPPHTHTNVSETDNLI